MVRDRLPDLVRYQQSFPNPVRQDSSTSGGGGDQIEICIDRSEGPDHRDIDRAFARFLDVREWINSIRYNTQAMKNILKDMTTTIQQQKLGELLEEKRQNNLTLSNKIYGQMKSVEGDLPEKGDFSALARIKWCQYYFYREDFMQVWTEHESFLVSYEDRMKKLLVRQAKIIDANIDEEELESLIENHETTSLFVGNILQQTQQELWKLQEIRTRHDELLKIEKSIIEVRDMFLRISNLVMEQSDQIKRIEHFATQTTTKVEKGGGALDKAREIKIKVLKKKTWLWLWIIGILLIIILLLAIF